MKTCNPKQINVALGTHIMTGFAEDSFVTVDAKGDGITSKTGCDGEVVRSVSPDESYVVKLSLLYGSPTTKFLQNKYAKDVKDGNGTFPLTIKDLKGGTVFSTEEAWVTKPASRGYGKEAENVEWELNTAAATISE